MDYLFLTGATGLVGRYLLRYLLEAGIPVAALVRPGRGPNVLEGILGYWEQETGRAFPRPVVIEGDLSAPGVVADAAQRQWLHDHADRLLNCAASMTFREDKRGDPFRTNVQGMQNLLQLCQAAGIRRVHHVSTAYICGLRTGRILETDIDLGQQLGNVYEQSKLQAEKLVRGAEFIDELTVYRPASVVGDSRTGYVSSFHGFYLPLQLAHSVAGGIPVREMNGRFFAQLGLKGDEGKNLVPVEWLASAIVYLVTHPQHHGRTYHLASPHPVPVVDLQRVIHDAIEQYYPKPLATSISEEELQGLEKLFLEYMSIYQSHWRDDPKFDLTNTQAALPHLPCPQLDYDALMRVARYPVEKNFIPPRHERPAADYDLRDHLSTLLQPLSRNNGAKTKTRTVGLQVNGPGGGQWQLVLDADRAVAAGWGLPTDGEACFYLSASTFGALVRREISVTQAINTGRVLVEGLSGTSGALERLIGLLDQVVAADFTSLGRTSPAAILSSAGV